MDLAVKRPWIDLADFTLTSSRSGESRHGDSRREIVDPTTVFGVGILRRFHNVVIVC